MDAKKIFDQLLADEDFQDDILKLANPSEDEQKSFLAKYSITAKELAYARRYFSIFSFSNEEINFEEINYALKRFMNRIANNPEASEKGKGKKTEFITWILRAAAILSIPLLLTTIYFYQEARSLNSEYITSNSSEKSYNTFQASLGARTQVALPDGSLVWLNSGSTLTCPIAFNSQSRNVELKGEAFFEVVKNPKVPMIVSAGNIKVKVYGTRFNVNSFLDGGSIETTLVDGKVTIISGDSREEYQLSPGYTAHYSPEDQKIQMNKVIEMDAFTGWKEGKLLFQNEPFSEIIKKLERWYNVDIQLSDASIGTYTLYATFFDESIEEILNIFSGSIPILIDYPKRVINSDGVYSKRQIIIKRDTNKKIRQK
jgi:transmembrane sensor